MKSWKLIGVSFAIVLFSTIAAAQQSKVDVFGGYSYLNVDTNGLIGRQSLNGWEASVSGNFNRWFAVEGDVAGYYKTLYGVGVQDYSYVAGPRVNYRTLFVHALLGGDHLRGSVLGFTAAQDGLAGAFGGGVQIKVIPHVSLRTSADYVFSRHNLVGVQSFTQNNVRASVGLVYSFGVHTEATRMQAPPPVTGVQIGALGVTVKETAEGSEIVAITPGGIGEAAGLRVGDVINLVGEMKVRTPQELGAALEKTPKPWRIGYMIRGRWQAEATVK